MGLDDWLLALHLLSAFAMAAAVVLFTVAVVVVRRTDLPEQVVSIGRIIPVGSVAIGIGTVGTIVFGIWLAIRLDDVQVWDLWVIVAIVLWAIAAETGRRGGSEYDRCLVRARELVAAGETGSSADLAELGRSSRGLMFHTIASLSVLLLLVDMIWKPGA